MYTVKPYFFKNLFSWKFQCKFEVGKDFTKKNYYDGGNKKHFNETLQQKLII